MLFTSKWCCQSSSTFEVTEGVDSKKAQAKKGESVGLTIRKMSVDSSTDGSVVEFSPATREARVRFPVSAVPLFSFTAMDLFCSFIIPWPGMSFSLKLNTERYN